MSQTTEQSDSSFSEVHVIDTLTDLSKVQDALVGTPTFPREDRMVQTGAGSMTVQEVNRDLSPYLRYSEERRPDSFGPEPTHPRRNADTTEARGILGHLADLLNGEISLDDFRALTGVAQVEAQERDWIVDRPVLVGRTRAHPDFPKAFIFRVTDGRHWP